MPSNDHHGDASRRELVKELFAEAIGLPPEQRDAFLRERCSSDASLRREVESLVRAAAGHPGFMAGPTADALPPSSGEIFPTSTPDEEIGTRIGPYKLLERLGEGGFGSVFVAEQDAPMRRRVALKLIKLGMDTRQVVARFEQERQALALMDHPNIAKVLDGGATATGRPYFVMELVRGVPLTEFCDANSLPTPDRLALFADICSAVQHAHSKGIIHRDLKPTNILVTVHDGKPVPKVIDFGIAKATQGPLTDKTVYTQLRQFIGTPAYTAPEQAEFSALDVDTRADVYALGVLLYELLTGTTPLKQEDLLKAGLAGMHRLILDSDVPKPSTRVSTLGERLLTVASRRRVEPGRLGILLRGDLDWIVMRALEKDRNRRYETAQGFADDIRRHLLGEPVVAAPPSAGYRLRKFVRRNRVAVATGSAVAAALLIGATVALVALVFARAALDDKEAAREELADANVSLQQKTAEAEKARKEAEEQSYVNLIGAASADLASGDPTQADARLRRVPEELRNAWEFGWLAASLDDSAFDFFLGSWAGSPTIGRHGLIFSTGRNLLADVANNRVVRELNPSMLAPALDGVVPKFAPAFAISPDGDFVAAAVGCRVGLFTASDGKLIRTLDSHKVPVRSVHLSPGGETLATQDGDGVVIVWEVASGLELSRLELGNPIHYLGGFGGNYLYLLSGYNRTALWDARSTSPPIELIGEVHSPAQFSAAGESLATLNGDVLEIFSLPLPSGRHIVVPMVGLTAAAFSPEGSFLAATCADGTTHLIDPASGRQMGLLNGPSAAATACAFDSSSQHLAIAYLNGEIRHWDVASRDLLATFHGPKTEAVDTLSYIHEDTQLVALLSGRIFTWDVDGPAATRSLPDTEDIFAITFAPDQSCFLVSTATADRVYDSILHRPLADLEGHICTEHRDSILFSSDSKFVIAPCCDGTAAVWDVRTGRRRFTFRSDSTVTLLTLSRDGKLIATAAQGGIIDVWSLATGRRVAGTRFPDGDARSLEFDETAQQLLVVLEPAEAAVIQIADSAMRLLSDDGGRDLLDQGGRMNSATADGAAHRATWLPSTNLILLAPGWRENIVAWHPGNPAPAQTWPGCFADGFELAQDRLVAYTDSWVRVHDPVSMECLSLDDSWNGIRRLSLSPSGSRMVSLHTKQTWDGGDEAAPASLWLTTPLALAFQFPRLDHLAHPEAAEWSPQGRYLALWNYTKGAWILDSVPYSQGRPDYRRAKRALDESRVTLAPTLERTTDLAALRERFASDPSLDQDHRFAALSLLIEEQDRRDAEDSAIWDRVMLGDAPLAELPTLLKRAQEQDFLCPENSATLVTLGATLYRNGDFADAVTTLARSEAALSKYPDHPANAICHAWNWLFLAMAHAELGQSDEACSALARGLWHFEVARWHAESANEDVDCRTARLLEEAQALVGPRS